jgi:queuine tRNA-ribosyltransferase
LFSAEEILGLRLASIHNLTFYQDIVRLAREHIIGDDFYSWKNDFLTKYSIE